MPVAGQRSFKTGIRGNYIPRDRYRYLTRYQILILNAKKYCSEKRMYHIVSFKNKIKNTYIQLT